MKWFSIKDNQVVLRILVKPYAKRNAIIAIDENQLSIAIHALPHSGEANQELIAYLSKLLEIPKTKITLKSGKQNRHKVLLLPLTTKLRYFIEHPMDLLGD